MSLNSSRLNDAPKFIQRLVLELINNNVMTLIDYKDSSIYVSWSGDLQEGIRLGIGNTQEESNQSYESQLEKHFMMYYQEGPPLISPTQEDVDNTTAPGVEFPWLSVYYPQESPREYVEDMREIDEEVFCGFVYDQTQNRVCKFPNYPLTMSQLNELISTLNLNLIKDVKSIHPVSEVITQELYLDNSCGHYTRPLIKD